MVRGNGCDDIMHVKRRGVWNMPIMPIMRRHGVSSTVTWEDAGNTKCCCVTGGDACVQSAVYRDARQLGCKRTTWTASTKKIKKIRSDITPDPGGHRPQRPCAQGRTYAKQDQPQASAPGQNQNQSIIVSSTAAFEQLPLQPHSTCTNPL